MRGNTLKERRGTKGGKKHPPTPPPPPPTITDRKENKRLPPPPPHPTAPDPLPPPTHYPPRDLSPPPPRARPPQPHPQEGLTSPLPTIFLDLNQKKVFPWEARKFLGEMQRKCVGKKKMGRILELLPNRSLFKEKAKPNKGEYY